jgi:hypothetical protein
VLTHATGKKHGVVTITYGGIDDTIAIMDDFRQRSMGLLNQC